MYLSSLQKRIVHRIANGDVKNIFEFLIKFDLIYSSVKEKPINRAQADFFFGEVNYKLHDREDAYERLIDFKKVVNLLIKAELIEIDSSSGLNFGYSLTPDRPANSIAIIDSFRKSLIIPYNEIYRFQKDFLTPQERNLKRQLWVPIVVALISIILTSIVNYFIYTNEREIYIKNVNEFKDSIYVKILSEIDSSLIQNGDDIQSQQTQNVRLSSDTLIDNE